MNTTQGPWMAISNGDELLIVSAKTDKIVAIVSGTRAEDQANAALISVTTDMLDALIAIQESINPANDETVIDLVAMNVMISNIFSRLANEAGLQ